jgi:hypothetical protein
MVILVSPSPWSQDVTSSPCHRLALTEGDEAQLLNYLKGTGYRVGLLLNFGAPSLEYKRRIL